MPDLQTLIQWIKDNPYEKRMNILRKAQELNDKSMYMTAVDYLENEFSRFLNEHDGSYENFEGGVKKFFAALKEAKQMEVEQIGNAFIAGGKSAFNMTRGSDFKTIEEYYTETYVK